MHVGVKRDITPYPLPHGWASLAPPSPIWDFTPLPTPHPPLTGWPCASLWLVSCLDRMRCNKKKRNPSFSGLAAAVKTDWTIGREQLSVEPYFNLKISSTEINLKFTLFLLFLVLLLLLISLFFTASEMKIFVPGILFSSIVHLWQQCAEIHGTNQRNCNNGR